MTASAARQYFAGTAALFGAAVEVCGSHDRSYQIAGRHVLVRAAGAELVARTDPALAGPSARQVDATIPPDLVVEMWDSAMSGVPIGQAPWHPDDLRPLGLVRTYCDERFLSAVDVHTASLSLFDRATSRARFWLEDARRMAYWQSASPLRLILSWWAAIRGMQLTHAAAVAGPTGAVLLVGGAGAGKSTTSLTCLLAGMEFLGDDYCLVTPGSPPVVHGVYTTAKLQPNGLERLPELRRVVRNTNRLHREKAILDLAGVYGDRLGASAPLRAIVVPRLTGRLHIERATPGTVVRAMAPSTVFGLFGATARTMPVLAGLAEDVPGYVLELSDDVHEVAGAVAALADPACVGE
jgi:hypothetical protein